MVFPKLKSLVSADLAATALPNNPDNFSIPFQAVIGPAESDGGDIFSFTAVSTGFLAIGCRTIWGRGLLVVPEFSWLTVQSAVQLLLRQSARSTWPEAAAEINKFLCWEFDNYQQTNA